MSGVIVLFWFLDWLVLEVAIVFFSSCTFFLDDRVLFYTTVTVGFGNCNVRMFHLPANFLSLCKYFEEWDCIRFRMYKYPVLNMYHALFHHLSCLCFHLMHVVSFIYLLLVFGWLTNWFLGVWLISLSLDDIFTGWGGYCLNSPEQSETDYYCISITLLDSFHVQT